MNQATQISIVMVEDNPDLAQTVRDFLSSEPKLTVLGEAREEKEFQKLIAEHLPDLALIDIGLTHARSGLELLGWLRKEYPVVKPVIMTVNEGDVLEAYQLGARGYVLKSHLDSLAPTLLKVNSGGLIIPPEVGALFVSQVAASTELWKKSLELMRFSEREREIMLFLKDGILREIIADRLSISFFTVRRHIQNILEKTGEPTIKDVLKKFGEVLGRKGPLSG
jgi:DNA-binding NarL/FixJ family response regulator